MGKTNRHKKSIHAAGDDPSVQFELAGERRRVTVRKFRKVKLIDIREFYEKESKWLPGSKGISLTEDQWKLLVSHVDTVNHALEVIDDKKAVAEINAEIKEQKRKDEEVESSSSDEDDGEDEDDEDEDGDEDVKLEDVKLEEQEIKDEAPAKRRKKSKE